MSPLQTNRLQVEYSRNFWFGSPESNSVTFRSLCLLVSCNISPWHQNCHVNGCSRALPLFQAHRNKKVHKINNCISRPAEDSSVPYGSSLNSQCMSQSTPTTDSRLRIQRQLPGAAVANNNYIKTIKQKIKLTQIYMQMSVLICVCVSSGVGCPIQKFLLPHQLQDLEQDSTTAALHRANVLIL